EARAERGTVGQSGATAEGYRSSRGGRQAGRSFGDRLAGGAGAWGAVAVAGIAGGKGVAAAAVEAGREAGLAGAERSAAQCAAGGRIGESDAAAGSEAAEAGAGDSRGERHGLANGGEAGRRGELRRRGAHHCRPDKCAECTW